MTGTQATEAARHLTPAVLDALSIHAHLYREPGAVLLQHRGLYGIYK